jgi:hypothetical protein
MFSQSTKKERKEKNQSNQVPSTIISIRKKQVLPNRETDSAFTSSSLGKVEYWAFIVYSEKRFIQRRRYLTIRM